MDSRNLHNNNTGSEIIRKAIIILHKMAHNWERQAEVRKQNITPIAFDESAADFLVDLLPFKHHDLFLQCNDEVKQQILTAGWIIYNAKTISIEKDILYPACSQILTTFLQVKGLDVLRQTVCQTMVDESYHTLLVVNAINLTQAKRSMFLNLPQFNLVQQLHLKQQCYVEQWQKDLVLFLTALTSELFISDYLKLLTTSETIQPIHRWTVQIHLQDELRHKNIFMQVATEVFIHLTSKEQKFFKQIIFEPIEWFHDLELGVWLAVLQQLNVKHAKSMINDVKDNIKSQKKAFTEHLALFQLAEELGIKPTIGVGVIEPPSLSR